MAYPQKSNWGAFINPQFNRLQSQIQQQTQALLRQRTFLTSKPHNNNTVENQPYLKAVQSQKYIKLNSDRSNNTNQYGNTRNLVNDKVKQLIDLCKNQNSAFGNQLVRVLNEQRNIYGDLVSSNKLSSQKTQYFGGNNPIMEAQKQSSVIQGSRQQPYSVMSSGNQSPTKANNPPKSTIREAIERNPKIQVGDDLLQMIEQIQRKALNEIQKLREQKIDLMKQLKQEIQSNNQLQRQINTLSQQKSQKVVNQPNEGYTPYKQYQQTSNVNTVQRNSLQQQIMGQIKVQMQHLRKQNQNLRFNLTQKQPTQFGDNSSQLPNLRSRNSLLQNELRNRDSLINQLTMEIGRMNQFVGSSSNVNARQLYEQGQAIRLNTLHLLKLKQGSRGVSNQNQRIRQLQQLLERQQEQKQSFLNDLLAFKQKYQQLQDQNRMLKRQSSKIGSSDLTKLSPIIDKSGSGQNIGASLDDYQKILSQMRGNRY